MLDFMKLSQLVSQIGADALVEKQDYERVLTSALAAFSGAEKNSENFEQKLAANAP